MEIPVGNELVTHIHAALQYQTKQSNADISKGFFVEHFYKEVHMLK